MDDVDFKMNNPLFFIHIPKTAGTSLRISANQYFGSEKIGLNYGLKAKETSEWVRKSICINNDFFEIVNQHRLGKCDFYTGHVHLKPYYGVFKQCNIFTFVRDPVDQVMSHYNHFVQHNGFEGTLEEFIGKPQFRNVQSGMLAGYQPENIGYIGITENYNESLSIINDLYGIQLTSRHLNVNNNPVVRDADKSTVELIIKNNLQDLSLYNKAKELHQTRVQLHNDQLPWTYGVIGHVGRHRIGGWAFSSKDGSAVELLVFKNAKAVGSVKANEPRQRLMQFGVPRGAYIGYSMNIEAEVGDIFEVKVLKTGQTLGKKQITEQIFEKNV